jgi:8-oxo-dGTP pyrophosphatase MutT (NUDIX family)
VGCVRREVREELGTEVKLGEEFAAVEYRYSHFTIDLSLQLRAATGREGAPVHVLAVPAGAAEEPQ